LGRYGVPFPGELSAEISEAALGLRLGFFHPAVALQQELVEIPHFTA
jgi:hypothetical protein